MAIQSIRIKNVMAFGCKAVDSPDDNMSGAFQLSFIDGINIIVGENGTGKTSLLKMIYAATQAPDKDIHPEASFYLHNYFLKNSKVTDFISSENYAGFISRFVVQSDTGTFTATFNSEDLFSYYSNKYLETSSVFIPTTEMLSHSKGFLALNQKYQMPFDQTQVDIIMNASLPIVRETPPYMKAVLDKISAAIDGVVIQEDDEFYVLKRNTDKIRFSLEAEGLRKLGLLWKLIRNGLLEPGTVLLWDEPEANLNPELFPLVVEILLELQKNGIQIFLATHSYNFAKYLEIRRTDKEQVQFHNLYHSEQPGVIEASSAYRMEDLHPNHIMMADNKLLDEIYNL